MVISTNRLHQRGQWQPVGSLLGPPMLGLSMLGLSMLSAVTSIPPANAQLGDVNPQLGDVNVQSGNVNAQSGDAMPSDSAAPPTLADPIETDAIETDPIEPVPAQSYIGVGAAIGLTGSSTAISGGGLSIFSRRVLNDSLSIRNNTIVFSSKPQSSAIDLTVDFPIRDDDSGEIIVSPFFGGGALIRNENGSIYVSPHATVGVDLPVSLVGLTATIRLDAAFPDNRDVDIGLLMGIGIKF